MSDRSNPAAKSQTPPSSRRRAIARALQAIGRPSRPDGGDAFFPDPAGTHGRAPDDLAESMGEEFIASATSGEEDTPEANDAVVPEELGGPFLTSNGGEEFADGVDESNPADATREPFPTVGRVPER